MARSASAARIWVQQPGTAKEIAVASNDMPWIVDSNGIVQYGTRELSCAGGLCVETGNVEWHVLGPGIAAHIAVALDNTVIMTDPSRGDIWLPVTQVSEEISGLNGNNWFKYFSSAPAGRPNNWYKVPTYYGSNGGTPACTGRIAMSADHNDYTSYFGIGCDGNMYGITPDWRWRNGVLVGGNHVWDLQIAGAKQVSMASQVNRGLEQTWWVLYDAHVHVWANDGFKTIEVPRWSNGKAVPGGVTYATDGFAIAGNFVWRWTQDINGGTGDARQDWEMYIGTTPNAPLAQIAHAGVLPPPNYYGGNWVGPSRLWALDTAGRIYVQSEDGSSN